MATERYTCSSTAALPRGHQGTPFESLRERRLAGLAVTERHDLLHAAVHDAVNGIERRYEPYTIDLSFPGASVDAAVARAAHDVLAELAPSHRERIGREYAAAVGGVPDGPAKDAESAA
ncbi:MAG TPA: hypothetical protein VMT79_13400 [Candidatus Binatia bacterium]|nr:hypothetical protein [Candidatus Binatia bacterium]